MKTIFSRRTHLTEPKLGLNLPTTGAAHVTLYHTWRPSDLFTGPHEQVLLTVRINCSFFYIYIFVIYCQI